MGPGVTPDESKGTVAAEHASAADASRKRSMGFLSVYGGSRLKQASRLVPVECCMHPVRYNKRGRSRMQREYVEIRNGAYYVGGSRVSLASIIYEYRDGAALE